MKKNENKFFNLFDAEEDTELADNTENDVAGGQFSFFDNEETEEPVAEPAEEKPKKKRGFFAKKERHPNFFFDEEHGYEVLRGRKTVTGTLLGGCLESLDDLLTDHLSGEKAVAKRYHLLPNASEWADKILFIETSEERPEPASYRLMLQHLQTKNILAKVRAILVGKPQNEQYYAEYKQIILEETAKFETPILFNCNFGHAYPRTVIPYGAQTTIDFSHKRITIQEPFFTK